MLSPMVVVEVEGAMQMETESERREMGREILMGERLLMIAMTEGW